MLLILLLLVLGIILLFISKETDTCHEIISLITCLVAVVALVSFSISSIVVIMNNVDAPATTAKMQQTYQSLTYQLDNINTLYGESRANDRKALYDDIQKWNETIASGCVKHNSLWLSWLYPIDYEQFELIELK